MCEFHQQGIHPFPYCFDSIHHTHLLHTTHTQHTNYTSPLLLAKKTYDGNFDCDATGLLYVVVEYLVVVYAGLLLLLDFTILLLVFTGLLH